MVLLGHINQYGALRDDGREKLAQVLSYIPLMEKVVNKTGKDKPINVLECASGKGHLSLLLNQVLSEGISREIRWIGVDSSKRLVDKCSSIAHEMDLTNVEYHVSKIIDYQDDRPITALLGLHACDTATDEALVKGLEMKARYIFLVPCCQNELSMQLKSVDDGPLGAMAGNPTHRNILGSMLTDSLRRLVMEGFGYDVDIFEYVSVRMTEKNVMIRGESGKVPSEKSWITYRKTIDDLGLMLTLDRLLEEREMVPRFD
jgi:hypothetical protein